VVGPCGRGPAASRGSRRSRNIRSTTGTAIPRRRHQHSLGRLAVTNAELENLGTSTSSWVCEAPSAPAGTAPLPPDAPRPCAIRSALEELPSKIRRGPPCRLRKVVLPTKVPEVGDDGSGGCISDALARGWCELAPGERLLSRKGLGMMDGA
jgi:hypothetical protein